MITKRFFTTLIKHTEGKREILHMKSTLIASSGALQGSGENCLDSARAALATNFNCSGKIVNSKSASWAPYQQNWLRYRVALKAISSAP